MARICGVVIAQDGQHWSHFTYQWRSALSTGAHHSVWTRGQALSPKQPNRPTRLPLGTNLRQSCPDTCKYPLPFPADLFLTWASGSLPEMGCIHSHIPNWHTINRPLVGNCGWRQFSHSEKTKEGCAAGGPQHNDVEVCGLSCPQGFQLSQYVRGDWEARFAGWLWPQTLNSPLNQRQLWHGFCSWLWQIPWNLQMSDGS